MSRYRNFSELREKLYADPERRAAVERHRVETLRELAHYELAELRRLRGRTQVQVAEALGVEQPSVSRTERGADPQLSTLRDYIEALGGHLELVATFDNGERVAIDLAGTAKAPKAEPIPIANDGAGYERKARKRG